MDISDIVHTAIWVFCTISEQSMLSSYRDLHFLFFLLQQCLFLKVELCDDLMRLYSDILYITPLYRYLTKNFKIFVTYGTLFYDYLKSLIIFPYLVLVFSSQLEMKICTINRTFKNKNFQHNKFFSFFSGIHYILLMNFTPHNFSIAPLL